MNNWQEYALLFNILIISINVLWYTAVVAGIVEWIIKVVKK